MALVMKPAHMLGIMLPLLVACDCFSILHYLGEHDWKRLRWLLPGLIAGIVVGTGVLVALRGMPPVEFNTLMKGIVGIICLAVVALQVYRLFGREVPTLPPHPASAFTVGGVAGCVSTINHAAGPIVTIYLLQEKLEKRRLVGTLLLYFLIGNAAKLPTYMLLPMSDGRPLINASTLRDSIWFIPLIPIGTLIGAWMNRHVKEKPFAAIMYVAAAASAAHMIWTSASWRAIGYGVGILALAFIVLLLVDKYVLRVAAKDPCRACGKDVAPARAAGDAACPECGEAFAQVSPD
jgi:uncharacterized membrane protein YfcA